MAKKPTFWLVVVIGGGCFFGLVFWNIKDAQKKKDTYGCLNCLREIDSAKMQWAIEHLNNYKAGKRLSFEEMSIIHSNATPTWEEIHPYLAHRSDGGLPKCPNGGAYTVRCLGDAPTCSIPGHVLN